MEQSDYNEKKLKGSCLIVEKIEEQALEAGVNITRVEWDGGALDVNKRDFHTLELFYNDKSVKDKFIDEDVDDFANNSGNAIVVIRKIVRQLK